jgi:hypothetical protein
MAINSVPSYLPIRKVPSMDNTGRQCLKASTHCGNHRKACTHSACLDVLLSLHWTVQIAFHTPSSQSSYIIFQARCFARHAFPYLIL